MATARRNGRQSLKVIGNPSLVAGLDDLARRDHVPTVRQRGMAGVALGFRQAVEHGRRPVWLARSPVQPDRLTHPPPGLGPTAGLVVKLPQHVAGLGLEIAGLATGVSAVTGYQQATVGFAPPVIDGGWPVMPAPVGIPSPPGPPRPGHRARSWSPA